MTVIASTGGLPQPRKRRRQSSLYDPAILVPAIGASFRKLNPRVMARNPVTVSYTHLDVYKRQVVDRALTPR